jgi:GNAT superfamily N-acetyltransferase
MPNSESTLPARFTPVSSAQAADPALRRDLLRTWVEVTDAGGAVGFVPPADPVAIGETLDRALEHVVDGRDALGVIRRGDGEAVGMGLLVRESHALRRHWRKVLRVMVRPELQGTGAGGLLLGGLHAVGRDLGLEHLALSVRGGTGTERFYEHFGYTEFGRHPAAIRLAPGDDRDEILMLVRL